MSNFDKNMQDALDGDSGFDPNRARSAQTEVYQTYQKKMKRSERGMWLGQYLFTAMGMYALWGFVLQATTTKEYIGYGMAIMWAVVFMIQLNIIATVTLTKLVTLKEIKQLRLALAGEATPPDEATAKPVRGLSRKERTVWIIGMILIVGLAARLGSLTNRQDDLWQLKAQGRIETHSLLTLRRFPHDLFSFSHVKAPVKGAVLQYATLNGQAVPFRSQAVDPQTNEPLYQIQLPYKTSWTQDKVELVWNFKLPVLQDYGAFHVPLRSLMPVHYYSLILYVEDDSGFEGMRNGWKFNKTPAELKDEPEARRTHKCFTWGPELGSGPRDDFGSCGLPIVLRPAH